MKQRTTFFVPTGSDIDPANIEVGTDRLYFPNGDQASLEKRYTFGLSELPEELASYFLDIHELHIRWSSPRSYDASSPNLSRTPPGLHVFYTPRDATEDVNLCALLKQFFLEDAQCTSVKQSFSKPEVVSERFSSSSTYQFFSPLKKLQHFQVHVARNLCGVDKICVQEAGTLGSASSFDLDFDTISRAVTMTAYWSKEGVSRYPESHKIVKKVRPQDSVEIGVLQSEQTDEPEQLKFAGLLTVLGQHEKPSPTRFSFPSRHHPLPAGHPTSFKMAFQQPTGLHPKLDITFPRKRLIPPKESCALHAYLTLPSAIFLDRYQLSDTLFLQSQNLISLRSLSGETDLEAPDWILEKWGSAALLELAHPSEELSTGETWTVTIPTHLRYIRTEGNGLKSNTSVPSNTTSGYESLGVPSPVLFWACEAEEGLKMSVNPFDRINLGYDGLFGPKTMLYHIPPAQAEVGGASQPLIEELKVPVLDPNQAIIAGGWVSGATTASVVVGFAWVAWKLLTGSSRGKKVVAKPTVLVGKKAE